MHLLSWQLDRYESLEVSRTIRYGDTKMRVIIKFVGLMGPDELTQRKWSYRRQGQGKEGRAGRGPYFSRSTPGAVESARQQWT